MLQLEFTVADVAQTRFAISPLWEVVAAVRVLKFPADGPLHRPWLDRVRPHLDGLDQTGLRMLSELVPERGIPAFVCPPRPRRCRTCRWSWPLCARHRRRPSGRA